MAKIYMPPQGTRENVGVGNGKGQEKGLDTGKGNNDGMGSKFPKPTGSMNQGGSGSAPTVTRAGWNNGMSGGPNSNADCTCATDMAVGQRKSAKVKAGNVYTSGPSVK